MTPERPTATDDEADRQCRQLLLAASAALVSALPVTVASFLHFRGFEALGAPGLVAGMALPLGGGAFVIHRTELASRRFADDWLRFGRVQWANRIGTLAAYLGLTVPVFGFIDDLGQGLVIYGVITVAVVVRIFPAPLEGRMR